MSGERIGEVVSASVLGGMEVKLELDNPEELKIGYPVIVEGQRFDFYSMVSDIVNQQIEIAERLAGSRFRGKVIQATSLHEGYSGNVFYSKAKIRPIKMIGKENGSLYEPDTIPAYFSTTRRAALADVETLYRPGASSSVIGTLRGIEEFKVNIDYARLTEKPFAIFGRTGVGKSILNKLVCLGILSTGSASVMVFDMHGEYGTHSKSDGTEGLKFFYPNRVEVFSLDENESSARPFVLSSKKIRPEDIIVAFQDLSGPMIDALYGIDRKRGGMDLISAIESADPESCDERVVHPTALSALQRRIGRLKRFSFIRDGERDSFKEMTELVGDGKSIVLDFADYGTDTMAYLFIANVLSRRLFNIYTERGGEMPRLVLFLEEAHKFLSSQMAEHTIFSKLARETRKFDLILALIDQRPARIDDEVRSQLANRLIMSLKEPSDVSSALAGVPERADWEKIVGTIPQRTAVVIGDAISIPTVLDVLNYDIRVVKDHLANGDDGPSSQDLDDIEKNASKII